MGRLGLRSRRDCLCLHWQQSSSERHGASRVCLPLQSSLSLFLSRHCTALRDEPRETLRLSAAAATRAERSEAAGRQSEDPEAVRQASRRGE